MSLTQEEQQELAQLESVMGLSPQEQQEYAELEAAIGGPKPTIDEMQNVVQEQHPDIGFGTRALVKNFSQSDDVTRKYLEGKGFETNVVGGQVVVKKPGEKQFKVIDPKELDLQDITDLGFDVTAGLGTGAATAAGGLAGNLPGAVAAGATSSAGLEALRQKIGAWAGLPQEVSGKDVAVAGALGGASPFVFGTGATATQAAKAAAQRGLSASEAAALAKAQTSPLLRGAKSTIKTAASMSSGVPKDVIESTIPRTEQIARLSQPGEFDSYINNLQKQINDPGEKLAADITDKTLDFVSQQQKGYKKYQETQLLQAEEQTKKALSQAEKEYADTATKTATQFAAEADKLEKSKLALNDPEALHKQLQEAFYAKKNELGEKMSSNINKAEGLVPTAELTEPMERVLAELQKSELASTPNGQTAIKELSAQLKSMFQGLPERISAKTAFELQDQFRHAGNLNNIKGGFQNRYGAGADMIAKKWSDANMAAYRNTNKVLDAAASTQGLKNEFRKLYVLQEKFDRYLSTPEKTLQTISTLNAPKNAFAKRAAEGAKDLTGGKVDLLKENSALLHNQSMDKKSIELAKSLEKRMKELERSNVTKAFELQKVLEARRNDTLRNIDKNENEALRIADKLASTDHMKSDKKLSAIYGAAGVQGAVDDLAKYRSTVYPAFSTPEKTAKTLVSASKKVINPNYETKIADINSRAGTDLSSDAELLRSYAYFKDPSLVQLSGQGGTSTTRTLTGAGIGGAVGTAIGGPGIGTAVGSGLGILATSPAAVYKGIQLYNKLPAMSEGAKAAPARLAPWLLMQQNRSK